MNSKRWTLGLLAALLIALGPLVASPQAQSSVAAQINAFSLALRYGSTTGCFAKSGAVSPCSFNPLQMQAGAYINWNVPFGATGYGIRDNGGVIEIKNAGGAWAAPSGGSSPLGTYLVQTATNAPANAQIMASLATGLVFNTTTTGVQSIYGGTSCTNQFPRSLSAAGAATCATVNLASDVTGILPSTSFPALSGDITTSSGSTVTTLATVTSGASRGSATSIPTFTVDAKGRITASGAATPQLTLSSTYFSSLAATNLTSIPAGQLTGTIPGGVFPALTGDVTNSAGSLATTVGKIGGNAVSLGSAFTLSGAGGLTFTITGATALTLPTSGNLVTDTVATLSSLSSIGTISTGVWQGTVVAGQYGGTGVANTGKTITLGGNLTTSGAFATTLTVTGATNITLPTTGTMISNTVTTLSNLVSIGTITTGVWNATPVTVAYGGCGQSSFTAYAVLAGGTTTTGNCQQVSGVGTSGQVLTSNGAAALPTWQAGGGSGTVTHTVGALTANQIVIGNGAADIQTLGALGTATTLLHGNVSGAPSFSAVVLTTDVSGLLPGGNGGTGVNNGSSTITLGGNLTTSGAFNTTLTVTAGTNVTLPTSGTLVNTAVTTLSSLVSVGTITAGTWNATPVTVAYGGCGTSSFSTYAVIAGGTTSTGNCQQVSGLGSAGQVLTSAGAGALPTWTSAGAGTVTATSGNLVSNQLVIGNGTTDLKTLGTLGTATTLLHGNAGGAPTFGAAVLTTDVTGTLPVANGGTSLATLTTYAILTGGTSSTGALQQISNGTAGQGLVYNGTAALATWQYTTSITTCDVRMTLTSGVPVTTSDVTGASAVNVYIDPYKGYECAFYDGISQWTLLTFTEITIPVPATTSTIYDVFCRNNAGAMACDTTSWASDTTRTTGLVTQNGVLVKSGDTTRRYMGSFRTTTSSGQTEDSVLRRFLWNYYNRLPRQLLRQEATSSWAYTTATVREANGSTSNQVDVVIGWPEIPIQLSLSVYFLNSTAAVGVQVGVGEDSTTTFSTSNVGGVTASVSATANAYTSITAAFGKYPAIGRHVYSWNEYSAATGATTWFSGGFFNNVGGLTGTIQG